MINAYLQGLGTGAGLIIAIGSQNAFVLSQALRGGPAMLVAGVCILVDATLITLGVWGIAQLIEDNPAMLNLARWGGVVFLLGYGALALKRAIAPAALSADNPLLANPWRAIGVTLAISLLNPHVYLDTVVLLGSLGGQLKGTGPFWFGLGACCASVLWFSTLALGGRKLAPWFSTPNSWRWLDGFVALTMCSIAAVLVFGD